MQPAYFIQEGLQMKKRMENQSFLQLKAAQTIGVGWGGRKPNIVGICVIFSAINSIFLNTTQAKIYTAGKIFYRSSASMLL